MWLKVFLSIYRGKKLEVVMTMDIQNCKIASADVNVHSELSYLAQRSNKRSWSLIQSAENSNKKQKGTIKQGTSFPNPKLEVYGSLYQGKSHQSEWLLSIFDHQRKTLVVFPTTQHHAMELKTSLKLIAITQRSPRMLCVIHVGAISDFQTICLQNIISCIEWEKKVK